VQGRPEDAPYSLWVGRDCASRMFGIEVEGEFDVEE